jgi:hypothetical protein
MSTKAEEFRYWQQRSGPKKPKQPRPPRRDEPVDTSKPGASATDRRAGVRKAAIRAGNKAVFALEASAGRPSRKSTRKSANRQKTDVQARIKRRTAESRPSDATGRGRPR